MNRSPDLPGLPEKVFEVFVETAGLGNARKVWMQALQEILSDLTVQTFANKSVMVCHRILPEQVTHLKQAWLGIGITAGAAFDILDQHPADFWHEKADHRYQGPTPEEIERQEFFRQLESPGSAMHEHLGGDSIELVTAFLAAQGIIYFSFKQDTPIKRIQEILSIIAKQDGVLQATETPSEVQSFGPMAVVQVTDKSRVQPMLTLLKSYDEVNPLFLPPSDV